MANCPSAVPDARTAMLFTADGVELVITARAPASQRRIRELARRHTALADPTGRALHSGGHGGPAGIGYCPVVHLPGTRVTERDAPGGVRLRMHADGEDADPRPANHGRAPGRGAAAGPAHAALNGLRAAVPGRWSAG